MMDKIVHSCTEDLSLCNTHRFWFCDGLTQSSWYYLTMFFGQVRFLLA